MFVFLNKVCVSVLHMYVVLVQFAAEMSHLLAASIEMAPLIGCTFVLVTKCACVFVCV